MPTLRELQAGFAAAIGTRDESAVAPEVLADGLDVSARLAIYRHHVFTSLTAALEATYPVVCRLVDRRFFAYAADRYIRENLPAGPCLFEYGESFPDFLAVFPPCRHLAYLPDVARLEWAMNRALHAADAPALDPATLRGVPPAAAARLTFRAHPSLTLLASPWPIDRIWRANQPDADEAVDLDAGPARLEVRRLDEDVVFRALAPAAFAFRQALGRGRPLQEAADAALSVDAGFDLAPALRAVLDDGIVVAARAVYPPPPASAAAPA